MQKFKVGCWILVLAITVPFFNLSAQEDDILVRARLAFYDGITQKLLKNETEAVQHFRTAVKLDPTIDAAFYNMADIFITSGRPSEAHPNAEMAYQLNPDNYWYGLLLVRTNSELKRFREAAVVLENMRKQNPQNADLVLMLADVQEKSGQWKNALKTLDLISPTAFNGNQWADFRSNIMARNLSDKQLERTFRKEIERFPDVDIYRLRLADLYRAMRKYKDALNVLNTLAAQQPLHPLVDLSIAQLYRDMGQNEESYSAIIRAFKNPFADPDTKIQLLGNMVQQALREPMLRDRAMEMVTLLLEQYPNEAKLHLMKGDLHFEEKQDLKALKSYEKVLALGNKSFVAFRQTMSLAAHMQAFDLLLPIAREAVELFPTHPTPYLYLSEALVQQKLYAAAEDTIRMGLLQVVSSDKPNTRHLNVLLARSLYGQNRSEEAKELLIDLSREFPGNTMVAVEYARFLWKSARNLEAALAKLEEAASFSSGNVAFNILNGEILLEAGRNEQALEAFQKALRQGGATSVLLEYIGDTYLKMEDIPKALEHWKNALDLYGANKARLEEKIKQHATN